MFRFHNYSPLEKTYTVILYLAGLSLRDLSERYLLVGASRESVREWVHRVSGLFNPSRSFRRVIAVDERVVKFNGNTCYIWSAVDVDSGEILAIYSSRGRSMLNTLKFMKRVLITCDGKPLIVVDRGPWLSMGVEETGIKLCP